MKAFNEGPQLNFLTKDLDFLDFLTKDLDFLDFLTKDLGLRLNVNKKEVQFFLLCAIFHTLPLFYLRT